MKALANVLEGVGVRPADTNGFFGEGHGLLFAGVDGFFGANPVELVREEEFGESGVGVDVDGREDGGHKGQR